MDGTGHREAARRPARLSLSAKAEPPTALVRRVSALIESPAWTAVVFPLRRGARPDSAGQSSLARLTSWHGLYTVLLAYQEWLGEASQSAARSRRVRQRVTTRVQKHRHECRPDSVSPTAMLRSLMAAALAGKIKGPLRFRCAQAARRDGTGLADATSKGECQWLAVMRPDALLVTALAAATVIASKPTKLVPTGSADATATAADLGRPGTSRWILS